MKYKTQKSFCSLIIAGLLIFSAVIPVLADSAVSFRTGSASTKPGNLTETDIFAQCGKKLSAAIFEIDYDSNLLEYRKISVPEGTKAVANDMGNCVRISYLCADGAEISTETAVLTLTFKALLEGNCVLNFRVLDCVDSGNRHIAVGECTAGSINISKTAVVSENKRENKSESGIKAISSVKDEVSRSKDKKSESTSSSSKNKQSGKDKKPKTKAVEKTEKTSPTVADMGRINDVFQKDFDRITPVLILGITAIAVFCIGGYAIYKIRMNKKPKNKDSDK